MGLLNPISQFESGRGSQNLYGRMTELVDVADLKSADCKVIPVQIWVCPPIMKNVIQKIEYKTIRCAEILVKIQSFFQLFRAPVVQWLGHLAYTQASI